MIIFNLTEESEVAAVAEQSLRIGAYIVEYFLLKEKKYGRDIFSVRVIQSRERREICRAVAYEITDKSELAVDIFAKLWQNGILPAVLGETVRSLLNSRI